MARIASLAILASGGGNDYLKELYGAVISNIQKDGITSKLKNTQLSGNPTSGTVEAKRFQNRTSKAYGTARGAGAGTKVTAEPVTIAINNDKEIITEIEQKDVSLYGVDNFLQRQSEMDEKSMERELEKEFFKTSALEGTFMTPAGSTIEEQIEELIQAVETVSNEYVEGVDRDDIAVVLKPAVYGKLRTYLDKVNDGGAQGEEIYKFHGVEVYSSVYLPTTDGKETPNTINYGVVMAKGAVAQPVLPTVKPAEQIPLSNAVATGLFFSYGTKAVSPDLIFVA